MDYKNQIVETIKNSTSMSWRGEYTSCYRRYDVHIEVRYGSLWMSMNGSPYIDDSQIMGNGGWTITINSIVRLLPLEVSIMIISNSPAYIYGSTCTRSDKMWNRCIYISRSGESWIVITDDYGAWTISIYERGEVIRLIDPLYQLSQSFSRPSLEGCVVIPIPEVPIVPFLMWRGLTYNHDISIVCQS